MPIVTLELVGAEPLIGEQVRQLANELGKVFGSSPGTTWLKVRHLPSEAYAENSADDSPDVRPVFVEILHRHLPEIAARAAEAQRVVKLVAAVTAIPEANVHVVYLPAGDQRVAFGGTLIGG